MDKNSEEKSTEDSKESPPGDSLEDEEQPTAKIGVQDGAVKGDTEAVETSGNKTETEENETVKSKGDENSERKFPADRKVTAGEKKKSSDTAGSEDERKEETAARGAEDADKKSGDEPDEEKETEIVDVSNEPALEDNARNQMFEEGLKLDKEGKKLEALKCYLKCLVGLKENSRFALLPQCLRNIGDIYYGRNEYEKAVSFIQAEKLYYESVLIDDTELQKHIDDVTSKGAEGTDANIDALRATEYEQLAKLCMDEKQPQLALEYAGKCTKLRQKVYGDGHPLVQQSLDYFATVYAEVGKLQYTESMSKYDPNEKPVTSTESAKGLNPAESPPEPTSILRRRKASEGDKEKKVRFDESTLAGEASSEREERCARVILLALFFMLLFVLIILGIYIFCSLQPSSACRNFCHVIMDTVMRIKYWYYNLWSGKDSKYS